MNIVLLLFFSAVLASAVPQRLTYLIPERRSEVSGQSSPIPYEYQIVPSKEYSMASYQPDDSSVLDYVLSPIAAIVSVGSTAISVGRWILVNCGLVLLGMSIVIGFCGLTSYCTMNIENPFGRGLPSIPYLDEIQYYFSEAYNKYHEMQSY